MPSRTSAGLPSLAALLALAALLGGCGNQILVAGLFINTPALPNPTQPGTMLGPYSALLSYVCSIDTSNPTNLSASSVTGITGAKLTLAYESCVNVADSSSDPTAQADCVSSGSGGTDTAITIPDSGAGLYELLSATESAGQQQLTFEQGVSYTLILQVPDGTGFDFYGASFQPGPPPHMVQFANKENPVSLPANMDFTVTRDDPPGPDGRLLPAALLVATIDLNNPTAAPNIVYTSLNYMDPKTLALLALSDEPYRVSSFTIPGSTFAASGYYVVTMVSLAEGKASENAFIGSTALAGSGDAGLVIVQ